MAKGFILVSKKRSARWDSTSQHRVTALEPLAGSISLIIRRTDTGPFSGILAVYFVMDNFVNNTQLFYRSVPRHLRSGAVFSEKKLERTRSE
jgi:hypothetical protein